MEQDKQMELKEFVEVALRDIFEGTKEAQKHILFGEIIPKKEGKSGEADIEFEIAVKPEDNKLVVVIPPAPPAPNLSKVKFKIPVRLPQRMGGFFHHLLEYYCLKRRENKVKPAPKESPSPPLQSKSRPEESAKKEEQKTETPKQ